MTLRQSKKGIQSYTQEAISFATQGRWQEAVDANKAILELSSSDTDAYNRLGMALMQLGKYTEANKAYSHSLKLDPYNKIAIKNLERLSHLSKQNPTPKHEHKVSLDIFIADAGKTGVVSLINLAPEDTLARLDPGDEVSLQVEGQKLLVRDDRGEYLGEVEPKYGLRLVKLIDGGNNYVAAINSLGKNKVKVIIHEVYQHPSQAGRLSFPQKDKDKEAYRPYTRDSLFNRRPDEEELVDTDDDDEVLTEENGEGFSITDVYEFPPVNES